MSRESNVEIFIDTERTVRENKILLESVENTIKKQKLYPAGSAIILEKGNVQNTKIIVSGKRTLEKSYILPAVQLFLKRETFRIRKSLCQAKELSRPLSLTRVKRFV